MKPFLSRFHLACALALAALAVNAAPLGTAFTYQGRLQITNTPANGDYNLQFSLWDGPGGNALQVCGTQYVTAGVTNGLFTVLLDFCPAAFNGEARWLQIGVQAGNDVLTLNPRQPVTPAPYALYASTAATAAAAGSVSASNLVGVLALPQLPASLVTNGASALTLSGAFSGNGAGLTNVWHRGGDTVRPEGELLGTLNDAPLILYAGYGQVMRLKNQMVSDFWSGSILNGPNVIGGYRDNMAANPDLIFGGPVVGATIAGGGGTIMSGLSTTVYSNTVTSHFGSIGGGRDNVAGWCAAVAGGDANQATGPYAFAAGQSNAASGECSVALGANNRASGRYATALGHETHASGASSTALGRRAAASGVSSLAVGEGSEASGTFSLAIGEAAHASGYGSFAFGVSTRATNFNSIAMGEGVEAYGSHSVALGSAATASGDYSMSLGRLTTASGSYSTALGHWAKATQTGAFVWADASSAEFDPYAGPGPQGIPNSFNVRSTGGFYVVTGVDGGGVPTAGVYVSCGGSGWNAYSDRNAKTNIETVNGCAILDQLVSIPIQAWNYKTQDPSVRHIGPMAQDFNAAFAVGEADKAGEKRYINTVDADGVALAAIQGLNHKLEAKNAALEQEMAELKSQMKALAEKVNGGGK
jgi:hypothetical protein